MVWLQATSSVSMILVCMGGLFGGSARHMAISEFYGCHAEMVLDVLTEERWVGEAQLVADLLDAEVGLLQIVADIL